MTQHDRIMKYMEEHGSISASEALYALSCGRLSARIHELRKSGIDIRGDYVTSKNQFGEPVSFKRYYIAS